MKKITFLFLLALCSVQGFSQALFLDFEDGTSSFREVDPNVVLDITSGSTPSNSTLNQSLSSLNIEHTNNFSVISDIPVKLDEGKFFKLQALNYSNYSGWRRCLLKFNKLDGTGNPIGSIERELDYIQSSSVWTELIFDFTSEDIAEYDQIVLSFNTDGSSGNLAVDNIVQQTTSNPSVFLFPFNFEGGNINFTETNTAPISHQIFIQENQTVNAADTINESALALAVEFSDEFSITANSVIDLAAGKLFKMQVLFPNGSDVVTWTFELNKLDAEGQVIASTARSATYNKDLSEWKELVFDFSDHDAVSYDQLVISHTDNGGYLFIDNITQTFQPTLPNTSLPLTFEDGNPGVVALGIGTQISLVDNPIVGLTGTDSAINNSNIALQLAPAQEQLITYPHAINLNEGKTFKLQTIADEVYEYPVLLKFESLDASGQITKYVQKEAFFTNQPTHDWQELTFDFSDYVFEDDEDATFDQVAIFFNYQNDLSSYYYLDNFDQYPTVVTPKPTVTAPIFDPQDDSGTPFSQYYSEDSSSLQLFTANGNTKKNASQSVGYFGKNDSGDALYNGMYMVLGGALPLAEKNVFAIDVLFPDTPENNNLTSQSIQMNLQNNAVRSDLAFTTAVSITVPITPMDEWQTVYFDFKSDAVFYGKDTTPVLERTNLDKIAIELGGYNNNEQAAFFFDNFSYENDLVDHIVLNTPLFIDFETGTDGVYGENGFVYPTDNPLLEGNESTAVLAMGSVSTVEDNIFARVGYLDLANGKVFKLQTRMEAIGWTAPVTLRLESFNPDGSIKNSIERSATYDEPNYGWQELSFDFSEEEDAIYKKMSLIYEAQQDSNATYYIDNIQQEDTSDAMGIGLPLDFEELTTNPFIATGATPLLTSTIQDNPFDGNDSLRVLAVTKGTGTDPSNGVVASLEEPLDFSKGKGIKMDVFASGNNRPFTLKISDETGQITHEVTTYNEIDVWEELVFDFSDAPDAAYTQLMIIPNNDGAPGQGYTYYFDNIAQYDVPVPDGAPTLDFENGDPGLFAFNGADPGVLNNPSVTTNNPSDYAGLLFVPQGTQYGGFSYISPINLNLGKLFKMKVKSQTLDTFKVLMKFETFDSSGTIIKFVQQEKEYSDPDLDWQELSFDFSPYYFPTTDAATFGRMTIFFDVAQLGQDVVYYYDDIALYNTPAAVLPVIDDPVVDDLDEDGTVLWELPEDEDEDVVFDESVDNPEITSENPSDVVGLFQQLLEDALATGFASIFDGTFDLELEAKFTIKVFVPAAAGKSVNSAKMPNKTVTLRLQNGGLPSEFGGRTEVAIQKTVVPNGTWQTLTFDFENDEVNYGENPSNVLERSDLNKVVLDFGDENGGAPGTFYFDDFAYGENKDVLHTPTIEAKSAFEMYPNPTRGELHLAAKAPIEELTIYNLQGRVIVTQEINATATTLDIAALTAGMYILTSKINGKVETHRLIKN